MNTGDPHGREAIVPAGGGYPATPVYAILPPGARRGVVVIHEIFGRQPEIDRVVRRFADQGYAAVEPDLFRASSRFGCIRQAISAMRDGSGPAVDQAAAIRAWLSDASGVAPANIGIIGFCFGGGFALAVGRGWGAVSTNYGVIPTNPEVLRGLGPTIGCYGKLDRTTVNAGPTLERRLRDVGVEVETHTFDDVGHAFLTDGNHGPIAWLTRPLLHVGYRPETADAAWRLIMDFFDRHLGD